MAQAGGRCPPLRPGRACIFMGEEGREKNDSGTRHNSGNQLLVRQRKCFLMFRLIIDQPRACLIAASCRLTQGSRRGRWWSSGPPGVVVTPHSSPSPRLCGRCGCWHGACFCTGEDPSRRTEAGWPGTALCGHGDMRDSPSGDAGGACG